MKIDNNIPIPNDTKGGKPLQYRFDELEEIGQSFLVKEWDIKKYDSIRVSATLYGQRHGMKFKTRKTAEGIRVWRTE